MDRPIILIVDDDPDVLQSLRRDMQQAYARDYRVLACPSGDDALTTVRDRYAAGRSVALFVVDQRMPGMTGVEFLDQAKGFYPEAKKALLTAYADTSVAIRAINEIGLDHYLLKPWDPPESELYPVVNELLADWRAHHRPPFVGVKLIDHRYSADGYRLRDFLSRNHVPYRWLDVERDAEAPLTLAAAGAEDCLPTVVLPDGRALMRPAPAAVAEAVGIPRTSRSTFYDMTVVGAGPAGLAAAVYGASEGLRVGVFEAEAPGGQAGTSSRIENYLGFPSGLSGADLSRRALDQAARFGAEIVVTTEVTGIDSDGEYRVIRTADGPPVSSHAAILATGVSYRRLDVPGFAALEGRGIYYGAALSEALACGGQDVAIVGAGNSAGQAALLLAGHARQVTILCRGPSLAASMSRYLVDRIEGSANIDVRARTVVTAVHGDDHVSGVDVENRDTGGHEALPLSALFVFIGAAPRTAWTGDLIAKDDRGFIVTGTAVAANGTARAWPLDRPPFLTETSLPGVFAVGDVRHGSVKRVASGVGDGAITVQFIHRYLEQR